MAVPEAIPPAASPAAPAPRATPAAAASPATPASPASPARPAPTAPTPLSGRSTGARLEADAREVLRRAGRRLRGIPADRAKDRCEALHRAVEELLDADAFMIGTFRETLLVIPYAVEDGALESPDVLVVREGSVADWVRAHARTYRFAQDGGAMLRDSYCFGDGGRPSADAIIAPVLSRDPQGDGGAPRVEGIIGVHSLRENRFDTADVRVLEALAALWAASGTPPEQEALDAELYRDFPELAPDPGDALDRLHEAATLVHRVRGGIEGIETALPEAVVDDVRERLRVLMDLCEDVTVSLADLAAQQQVARPGPRAALTPREEEIAQLIVTEGLGNREIAQRLFISEKTVKTHVGSVLRKCGQTQRSGIALVIPPREGALAAMPVPDPAPVSMPVPEPVPASGAVPEEGASAGPGLAAGS